jgi:uncharacterized phage protein (TIGR01671 family)
MREILFRGKANSEIRDGEWVYGSLLAESKNTFPIIAQSYDNDEDWLGIDLWDTVEPETVGQYTGLTDKNGNKIFEGDIVDCWSEGVNAQGTVQQRRDGLWIIYPAWQKHIMWGLCPDEYSNTTVEVIGNVHDNPELIKT